MAASECSICLDTVSGEAYLDQCFHKFCYHCILQWAESVSRQHMISLTHIPCPLCKVQSTSIIHNFRDTTYQRHYFSKLHESSFSLTESQLKRLKVYTELPATVVRPFVYLKIHGCLPHNRWAEWWIERELQALLQEKDVKIITLHVLGILEPFQKRERKMLSVDDWEARHKQFISSISDAVKPFLFEKSQRFAMELEAFLISGLNIAAYDELH